MVQFLLFSNKIFCFTFQIWWKEVTIMRMTGAQMSRKSHLFFSKSFVGSVQCTLLAFRHDLWKRERGVLASEAMQCLATICSNLNRVDRQQESLTYDKLCLRWTAYSKDKGVLTFEPQLGTTSQIRQNWATLGILFLLMTTFFVKLCSVHHS